MSYTQNALEHLKNHGYRITKPRRLVVELLDKSDTALSAYEIKDLLNQSQENVDTASIYRILECLEENHLIHRILSTGKVRKCQLDHEDTCNLEQPDHCHHFLICTRCGTVEELHCLGLDTLVQEIEFTSNFQIQAHHLEFSGLCKPCQSAS